MFCSFLVFIIYCWKEIIYFENLGSSLEFPFKIYWSFCFDSVTKFQNPISMWTFWFNNCMNAFYPFRLFMQNSIKNLQIPFWKHQLKSFNWKCDWMLAQLYRFCTDIYFLLITSYLKNPLSTHIKSQTSKLQFIMM